jgi:hypothetical protein
MDKLEPVLKALPGITAAALIAAVLYGFGYFAPFGTEWIATLSIKDLLAMTWVSFPTVLLGLVFGFVTRSTGPGPAEFVAKSFRNLESKRPRTHLFLLFARVIAVVLATAGPLLFVALKSPLPNSDMYRLLVPLTLTHLVGVAGLVVISKEKDRAVTALPTAIYMALVLILLFGAITGYSLAAKVPSHRVVARDNQAWCATLVLAGERGAIFYDPKTEMVTLTRWEEIKSISKLKHCSVPVMKGKEVPEKLPTSEPLKAVN